MTRTGNASLTIAKTESADLRNTAMDGGMEKERLVMVKAALMTETVKILNAEEVSALTRLLFAMPTGSPKKIDVMASCA